MVEGEIESSYVLYGFAGAVGGEAMNSGSLPLSRRFDEVGRRLVEL